MSNSNRREFVKITSLVLIGSAVLPQTLLKGFAFKGLPGIGTHIPPLTNISNATVFGIVDMHAHPSQKLLLLDELFWKHHYPRKRGDNLIREQIDKNQLLNWGIDKNGDSKRLVMGMIATHYLPELGTATNSNILKRVYNILDRTYHSSLANKVELEDMTNFSQLNSMMGQLEMQMDRTNKNIGYEMIRVVTNFQEFSDAIDEGIIPFAHALEGSHSLGRIKPNQPVPRAAYLADIAGKEEASKVFADDDARQKAVEIAKDNAYKKSLGITRKLVPNEINKEIKRLGRTYTEKEAIPILLERLEELQKKGVCLITLAHFFSNDIISYPVYGISPDSLNEMHLRISYLSSIGRDPSNGLTTVGQVVVNKMLDIGIIVDLTHCNPSARKDVFNILEERRQQGKKDRPIVFSHSGARVIFNNYAPPIYPVYHNHLSNDFGDYNVDNDEILQVQKCGGVIGIIPEVFWLTGRDTHCSMGMNHKEKKKFNNPDFRDGIRFMLETIEHIHNITGDYNHIAIGSDFDGLADAAKNLATPSQFGNLTDAMQKSGISDDNIIKMTSSNALRVLRDGWGIR